MRSRNSAKKQSQTACNRQRGVSGQGSSPLPSRRQFLRTAPSSSLALVASPFKALADHHGHPTPNSLTYLDRRMYIHNMELLAHFAPGQHRGGKMQLMSAGSR